MLLKRDLRANVIFWKKEAYIDKTTALGDLQTGNRFNAVNSGLLHPEKTFLYLLLRKTC